MNAGKMFITILARLFIAFLVLFAIYFLFDPFNVLQVEADAINFIVFGLYASVVLPILTIAICSVFALPFWFWPRLRSWWKSKPLLQIVVFATGLLLLLLSVHEHFRMPNNEQIDGQVSPKSLSNQYLSLPGWLIVALFFLVADLSRISDKLFRIGLKNDWTERPADENA